VTWAVAQVLLLTKDDSFRHSSFVFHHRYIFVSNARAA
jgi:hypothetical protein